MLIRKTYISNYALVKRAPFYTLVTLGLFSTVILACGINKPDLSLRIHSMEIPGVMDADISPDGRDVAFVVQRVVSAKDSNNLTFFNDLQVWDLRQGSLTTQKTLWEGQAALPRNPNPYANLQRALQYSHDGRSIAFSNGNIIHILNTSNYDEKKQFSLAPFPGTGSGWASTILRISPADKKVAVYLADNVQSASTIRVYDLTTGHLDREVTPPMGVGSGGLAWSPDGTMLVFMWLPVHPGESLPAEVRNARIIEVASGHEVCSFNTGYVAGPIEFLSDSVVITASKNPDPRHFSDDTIKFWDVKTGRLLRQITSPDTGVRNAISVSSDGRRIMGYTGKERYDELTHDNQVLEQRFRIWDSETGQVLVTSPAILPKEFIYGLRLRLSAKGDVGLVWGSNGKVPPTVYEVPKAAGPGETR